MIGFLYALFSAGAAIGFVLTFASMAMDGTNYRTAESSLAVCLICSAVAYTLSRFI